MHNRHHPKPATHPTHSEVQAPHHGGASTKARLMRLLGLLCLAQLMVILDISAVNVALPDMASGLGIEGGDHRLDDHELLADLRQPAASRWSRSPTSFGRRRMFMTGLGRVHARLDRAPRLAGSASVLFAARAAQGLGAAMLSPAALSILMSTFREGHQRAHALAAWGAVGGAGAAIGVLVGGALTSSSAGRRSS